MLGLDIHGWENYFMSQTTVFSYFNKKCLNLALHQYNILKCVYRQHVKLLTHALAS